MSFPVIRNKRSNMLPTTKFFLFFHIVILLLSACGGSSKKRNSLPPAIHKVPNDSYKYDPQPCTADQGFEGGCIAVNLKSQFSLYQSTSDAENIDLFYQWLDEEDPEKPVIVVVNGGPGGGYESYAQLDDTILTLRNTHNILFYDQRGVGKSSRVEKNTSLNQLMHFHTSENIDDIEQLRTKVIRREKIILLGHSYGAHIAFGYAARYPNSVEKLLALNGAMDNKAFMLQLDKRLEALHKIHKLLDVDKLEAFHRLLFRNEIFDAQGLLISQEEFSEFINSQITTFAGQDSIIYETYSKLFIINSFAISQEIQLGFLNFTSSFTSINFASNNLEDLNTAINTHIVCHDFIGLVATALVDSSYALQNNISDNYKSFFKQRCSEPELFDPDQIQIFDVTKASDKIISPVLIVGGDSDPLTPLEVQVRDFEILRATNDQTLFLEMQNTGHQVFYENPACLMRHVREFLSNPSEKSEKIFCDL